MYQDSIQAKGAVTIALIGPDGNVKEQFEENMVVATGLAYIASRMKDAATTAVSHMALGTGEVAAVTGNTALGAEAGRVALTSTSIVTTTATNDSIQYVASFGPGVATAAITEAGLFNAASGPALIARVVFGVVTKGALDTLAITWKITIS